MTHSFKLKGNSMLKLIESDDIAIISKKDKYRFGDILVYQSSRGLRYAHRLFYLSKRYGIVAGDNCIRFEKIATKDIIGTVVIIVSSSGEKYFYKRTVFLYILTGYLVFFIPYKKILMSIALDGTENNIIKKLAWKLYFSAEKHRNWLQHIYLKHCQI